MERDCSKALQVLRHLGCSSQDAEEIVQEALLRLYRYRGDVKSTQAFVVHISKNLFIDLARKRRGREIPFNERFLSALAPSPESQLNIAQQLRAVSSLLVTKCGKQIRDIFIANKAGWKHSEIAAHFKVSASIVHRCIAKAIKIIADDAK
ncbi:MAG: Sigma-70 region 2 [Gammaproteobacteria bacterium]|nr:Sigma-70 region 2 [Gammaproteobacteria bacterium]